MKSRLIGDDPRNLIGQTVALDTETTGLKWKSHILGVSLAWMEQKEYKSCYLAVTENRGYQLSLKEQMFESINASVFLMTLILKNRIILHNLSFDYRILFKELRIPPIPEALDTMTMGKMVAFVPSKSLENMVEQFTGKEMTYFMKSMKKKRKNLVNLDIITQSKYARGDALATLALYEAILPKYQKAIDSHTREETIEFNYLVMMMMFRGIPVDFDYIKEKKTEFRKKMMEIQIEFSKKGVKNISSVQQVRKYVTQTLGIEVDERTGTDKASMSKDILKELADEHEELKDVVAFREYQKAIGSWLDDIEKLADKDGRVHGQLNPYGTASFRISSTDINLQAIPFKDRGRAYGHFKGIFKNSNPEVGLYEIDISQAEVRLACIIASENNLAEVLEAGEDPYVELALRMWNNRDRRQDAKSAMLSSIYAIGPDAFAEDNNVSVSMARDILNAFQRNFPNISRATQYWDGFVIDNGYVPLPLSNKARKVYFDPVDSRTYRGFNQIVQSTVAEFIDRAMIQIEEEMPGNIIHQIHDSVIMEVGNDQTDVLIRAKEIIEKEVLPEWFLDRTTPKVVIKTDVERWDS